jgi:hypothetical protein
MTLIGKVRSLRYQDGIDQRAQDYSTSLSEPSRLSIQLELWNAEWRRLRTHVPYFRSLAQEWRLPIEFTSWQEFIQTMPIMTRAEIQKNKGSIRVPGSYVSKRSSRAPNNALPRRLTL